MNTSKESQIEKKLKSDIFIIIAIFTVSIIVKLFMVLPAEGPVIFLDEYLYKQISLEILNKGMLWHVN